MINRSLYILVILIMAVSTACSQKNIDNTSAKDSMNYNKLTPEEERVIINKGTEMPFTGKYDKFYEKGTYVCKRCNAPLYHSSDKFDAGCGWPSFDDAIPGAVKMITDRDGIRTEILCNNCGAHLGHVFTGEYLTKKNTRYCVNSVSMAFVAEGQPLKPVIKPVSDIKQEQTAGQVNVQNVSNETRTEKAIFASGCFWGTQYMFENAKGVISTRAGYTGGTKANPTYKEVCSGTTGHVEAVEITYDPSKTTYENLAKLYFETHDFTQTDGQGPDIGQQYLSVIFYFNDAQKQTAEKLMGILREKGYKVATQLKKASEFWQAEDYHQNYYDKTGGTPYCHAYRKIF